MPSKAVGFQTAMARDFDNAATEKPNKDRVVCGAREELYLTGGTVRPQISMNLAHGLGNPTDTAPWSRAPHVLMGNDGIL
jgi:hypothetical protein